MKHILVTGINDDTLAIGFINSRNELEYTMYKAIDGGIVTGDKSDYKDDFLASLLALETVKHPYMDYTLKEITV